MTVAQWEAAELAGILTTYIAGIEDNVKESMLDAHAYLTNQVDAVYETLAPVVGDVLAAADVNLPGE